MTDEAGYVFRRNNGFGLGGPSSGVIGYIHQGVFGGAVAALHVVDGVTISNSLAIGARLAAALNGDEFEEESV